MSESQGQTPAQKMIGDFLPKMVSLTDDVLFGDVWERVELSKRDRSLITVAALITGGNTEQLSGHLMRARRTVLLRRSSRKSLRTWRSMLVGQRPCLPLPWQNTFLARNKWL